MREKRASPHVVLRIVPGIQKALDKPVSQGRQFGVTGEGSEEQEVKPREGLGVKRR